LVVRHVEVVDEGAPFGILAAVRAEKARDPGFVRCHPDDLVHARAAEPLAPHVPSVPHQVAVQERVEEVASIRAPPATGVKLRDGFGICRSGDSVSHVYLGSRTLEHEKQRRRDDREQRR